MLESNKYFCFFSQHLPLATFSIQPPRRKMRIPVSIFTFSKRGLSVYVGIRVMSFRIIYCHCFLHLYNILLQSLLCVRLAVLHTKSSRTGPMKSTGKRAYEKAYSRIINSSPHFPTPQPNCTTSINCYYPYM